MRQGSEGEKVSRKRDKMITVEKHSVWGTDVAVTARSASFGRETALLFVNSTAKTWTHVKSDRIPDESQREQKCALHEIIYMCSVIRDGL